ncbi:MAG TPA: phosphotransferase [Mycobacteriales bacterium]|nr:phosphotransferase [Mycobacteriales bacterium]
MTAIVDVLASWGVPPTATVAPMERGTNNDTRLVVDGDRRYVLRGYRNLTAEQAEREHRLLRQLSAAGLPFAVPVPIPADGGRTVRLSDAGPIALFGWIPGRRPDPETPQDWERIGAAAGRLQGALAEIDPADAPQDWRQHVGLPPMPDVVRWLEESDVDSELTRWLSTARVPNPALPVQVIHCDLGLSNLLVGPDGAVCAVLDFEVAGADLRANELVALVVQSLDLGTPGWAERVSAISHGFRRYGELTAAEVQAMPDLFLLRELGSAQWRAGKWRRRADPAADPHAGLDAVLDRVRAARDLGIWLDGHGDELIAAVTAGG